MPPKKEGTAKQKAAGKKRSELAKKCHAEGKVLGKGGGCRNSKAKAKKPTHIRFDDDGNAIVKKAKAKKPTHIRFDDDGNKIVKKKRTRACPKGEKKVDGACVGTITSEIKKKLTAGTQTGQKITITTKSNKKNHYVVLPANIGVDTTRVGKPAVFKILQNGKVLKRVNLSKASKETVKSAKKSQPKISQSYIPFVSADAKKQFEKGAKKKAQAAKKKAVAEKCKKKKPAGTWVAGGKKGSCVKKCSKRTTKDGKKMAGRAGKCKVVKK